MRIKFIYIICCLLQDCNEEVSGEYLSYFSRCEQNWVTAWLVIIASIASHNGLERVSQKWPFVVLSFFADRFFALTFHTTLVLSLLLSSLSQMMLSLPGGKYIQLLCLRFYSFHSPSPNGNSSHSFANISPSPKAFPRNCLNCRKTGHN